MGEEKYSNFDSPAVDKMSILPDIKFGQNWSIKVREIALAACLFAAVVACVALAAVLAGKKDKASTTMNIYESICVSGPCLKSAAYVTQNMNKSVDPCSNFYRYACDGYPKQHPLTTGAYQRSVFSNLYDENQDKIENILAAPIQRSEEWSSERKLKHLFQSCTDTYRKDVAKGTPVLNKVIPQIGGWSVLGSLNTANWDFKDALKKLFVNFGTHAFFTVYVATDWYNTDTRILEIHLSGTSMYWYYYTSPDTEKYRNDLKSMMRTLGSYLLRDSNVTLDDATKTERLDNFVNDAFYVESMLANITMNTLPAQDPHLEENKETLRDFDTKTGNVIDFTNVLTAMFAEARITPYTKVVVYEEDYLIQMANLVGNLGVNSSRILNNYLVWRVIWQYRQELSWDYVHANRDFYVDLYGVPNFLGTARYCLMIMRIYLGDALGSLFIRDHFSDTNKDKAEEIVQYVKDALTSSTTDDIFDAETKTKAKEKLESSIDKLGYPDFMMDNSKMDSMYQALKVDDVDYFTNVLYLNNFLRTQWNERYQKKADKSEWLIDTYSTSIYFYNGWNELLVSAGLLQFPFYDYTLPHFMNFGTMGSLIGHYLVHGIDHIGAYYEKDGSFSYWWSNYTQTKWSNATKCVGDYYSTKTMGPFTVPGDPNPVTLPVNGKYYAPEAIAETSGVRVAYKAYLEWVKRNGEEKKAPGLELSNEQTFFLAFAQNMCYSRTDEAAYSMAVRGSISEDVRTNSILAQLPEFAEAFKCPKDSPMNVETKCNFI